MLYSSTSAAKHCRRCAAVLRPLISKLCFSSSTTTHHCVSFPEDDLIQSKTTAEFLSECLSDGRHSDILSLLRRTPPSRYLVFYWNNLIKRSVSLQDKQNALHLFDEMRRLAWIPDGHTYPYVLKACGDFPSLATGVSVHALTIISGFTNSNVFVDNAAIAMYGRCGAYDKAHQLFGEMLESGVFDTISWNSIISMYMQIGDSRKALRMFKEMISKGDMVLRADSVTLTNALSSCASLRSCRRGKEIHAYAVTTGLIEDVFVGSAVMDMYAKIGRTDHAKNLFDRMEVKDVVSWTALVSGYAQRGLGYEALDVFKQMIISGSLPNVITLVSVISGCAVLGALAQGKETHCFAIKRVLNLDGDDIVNDMKVITGLIDMYAKCKNLDVAHTMFDSIEMKNRSVVSWTALIGGHAQHGKASDALRLFSEMLSEGCRMPNGITISCALVACARVGALRLGQQIHAYALHNCYGEAMVLISNCLIDMYAKSGDVDTARAVFDFMICKDEISWTSMIKGYGMHGRGEEAVHIFEEMRTFGLPMDGVTFVVLLYSCSHSGIVDQGIHYFNCMKKDYGVVPEVEHYACMVDLLGRAGRLYDAVELVYNTPIQASPYVWMSLLTACSLSGNVEIGEHAFNKILELKFEDDGSYTLLSNIYASAGLWKDVARIRLSMKHEGIRKTPGCSWIQGRNGMTTFYAGDKSHPMANEIYDLLRDLIYRAKIMGYVPETSFVLRDVDEQEKGDLLLEHSEKLALAYGILTTSPAMPVRIIKNLRVCGDCHTAISYISRIVDHEVILRDSSRFHHFKNGSCSCKGYW